MKFQFNFFSAITSIMMLVSQQRMVSFGASFFCPQRAPTENCPTCCLWTESFHYSFSDFWMATAWLSKWSWPGQMFWFFFLSPSCNHGGFGTLVQFPQSNPQENSAAYCKIGKWKVLGQRLERYRISNPGVGLKSLKLPLSSHQCHCQ